MGKDGSPLNSRIIECGQALFSALEGEKPSLFQKRRWVGVLMDLSMRDPVFRTQMLRFVDVFPTLHTVPLLVGHLKEYFGDRVPHLSAPARWIAKAALSGGKLGSPFVAKAVRIAVDKLGRQFIVGATPEEAARGLEKVRREGCAFSVDILGEAVISEEEAEDYGRRYLTLLDYLDRVQDSWPALGARDVDATLDWGYAPRLSISFKPTSLYSQVRPMDFHCSVAAIMERVSPIYERVISARGSLSIDMESYAYKEITLAVFKGLREAYPAYPHLTVALQAYLKDTDSDLSDLLAWSRSRGLSIGIRLVKGAYWDYEVIRARQNGWPCPVYAGKEQTDAAFERLGRTVLENHDVAYLACSSHNIRSISSVLVTAREMDVPADRYEFQVLYGMAEPIRRALVERSGRVRLYCPHGPIVPGIAYLVRRLLENTANQGFLRQVFSDRTDVARLLRDPAESMGGQGRAGTGAEAEETSRKAAPTGAGHSPAVSLLPFQNQPTTDFARRTERDRVTGALASVRGRLGLTLPLFINGTDRMTDDRDTSVNPARPTEAIAYVCQAGVDDADEAIAASEARFGQWQGIDPSTRAEFLIRAAAYIRDRQAEYAAWQVLEIGKQWDQASADVAEAVDFLEYYAREMKRLGEPRCLISPPGEINHYLYEPRGVALVIAPWNFPLAISCGMVSAAIVTGNCVVYKPSPFTPLVGHLLVEAFRAAGLPDGVFNYVPGRTDVIAEYLVDHPRVSTIAFTGSTRVGLNIIQRTAIVKPGQSLVKRVICEMGGKNAIIVDEDADLDEAIPGVIYSAFGFQGQKCSSCSRVIVLDSVYDAFVSRLVQAARSLVSGPPEEPACVIGPVSDERARERILEYIEIGRHEGTVLYQGETPPEGFYVPVTILGGIRPEHRIAQEEIFGPVLAIMRVKTFGEALEWANSTRFALTGGVYSRSPRHMDEARRLFAVGNLYLNRHITGALVGRQPFGVAAFRSRDQGGRPRLPAPFHGPPGRNGEHGPPGIRARRCVRL